MDKHKSNQWEQQPGESPEAFQAFATFRDLGPGRSLAEVSRSISKTNRGATLVFAGTQRAPKRYRKSGHVGAWSVKYGWVERAAAWDAIVDQRLRAKQLDEIEAMAARHAKQAMLAAETLLSPVIAFAERLQTPEAQQFLQDMPLSDLFSLVCGCARLLPALHASERLARGVRIEKKTSDSPQGGYDWTITVHQPAAPVADMNLDIAGLDPAGEWEGDRGSPSKPEDDAV